MKNAPLIFGLFAAGLVCGCGRGTGRDTLRGPEVVRFTGVASPTAKSGGAAWNPILMDLSRSARLKVAPNYVANGTVAVRALANKKADFGWFDGQAALEAVRRGNGEVFARAVDPNGAESYTAVLVVPARSKISLDAVLKCDHRLVLGLGDTASVSGWLAPMAYLFGPREIRPAACFRRISPGDATANLAAVETGQVDVATSSSTALAVEDNSRFRVIWRSPALPDNPLILRKDLDPAVKERLRQFFLTYGQGDTEVSAHQRALLARLDIGAFRAADDTHLLPLQEMEATRAWLAAKDAGQRPRILATRKALDAIVAQRQALEARTRAPAAAQ